MEHREIGAERAEGGQGGPAVAQQKGRRKGRQDQVGAHAERGDGIYGRAEVGQDDGQNAQGLRFSPFGQEQGVKRPQQQENAAQERARYFPGQHEPEQVVEGEVKAEQSRDEQQASEKGAGGSAIEALADDQDNGAGQAEQPEFAHGAEAGVHVKMQIGPAREQEQRQDKNTCADTRDPPAEMGLERGPRGCGNGRQGRNRRELDPGGGGWDGRQLDRLRRMRKGRQKSFRRHGREKGFGRAATGPRLKGAKPGREPFHHLLEVGLLPAQREEHVAIFVGHGLI